MLKNAELYGLVRYMKSAVCLCLIIILALVYTFFNDPGTLGFKKLLLDLIPSSIVVLAAYPIIYFFLQKKGLSDNQQEIENISLSVSKMIMSELDASVGKDSSVYTYINGEVEAMEALRVATLRAESEIRSTRFFPMPIRENHPDYAEAIRSKVLGTHSQKSVDHYFRIVSVNHKDKLKDCIEYIESFKGRPFTLYLVGFSNDFELVIIDGNETFIHFYADKKVISSTLHLRGVEVASRFKKIFSRLHEPAKGRDVKKIDLKYIVSIEDANATIQEIQEYFDRQLAIRKKRKREAAVLAGDDLIINNSIEFKRADSVSGIQSENKKES